jgi:Chaperone of endosialidase
MKMASVVSVRLAATVALSAVSSTAFAITLPDSGSCNGNCLSITSNAGTLSAIGGTTTVAGIGVSGAANSSQGFGLYATNPNGIASFGSGVTGVKGVSSATGNTGYGVYGVTAQTSLGVGVKGEAPPGSTAVWGLNINGQAAWFDGKTTANGDFQVNGNPFCAGCTAFTNNSDSRLKKNIKTVDGALEQLLRLRGVTFEWKEPAEHGNHRGLQRGFVAQEVEQVMPEWVGVDEKGFKTLNTTGLEALLVESIRTLKTENDALRDRVRTLEGKNGVSRADLGQGAAFGLIALVSALVVSRRRQDRQK